MIFKDHCEQVGIPMEDAGTVFHVMLKSQAREYYYAHIYKPGAPRDLKTRVQRLRAYFHSKERVQSYVTEWHTTTLDTIQRSHPGKSTLESLDLLFTKLEKIQRALPLSADRTEEALRVRG